MYLFKSISNSKKLNRIHIRILYLYPSKSYHHPYSYLQINYSYFNIYIQNISNTDQNTKIINDPFTLLEVYEIVYLSYKRSINILAYKLLHMDLTTESIVKYYSYSMRDK
jgi:hypothetical protein